MKRSTKMYGEVRGVWPGIGAFSPEISQVMAKPEVDAGEGTGKTQSPPLAAFIGPGVQCKGVMTSEGQMRIEGCLEGEIHTKGTVLVGEQAVVKAQIRAGTVISKGRISGTIVARREVRLLSSAVVTGSLSTPHLSVEKGAKLDTNWSLWVNRSRISGRKWIENYPYGGISHPTWWNPK